MGVRLASLCLTILQTGCGLGGSGANPQVSDEAYVAIARSAPEAKAFDAKYRGDQATVDRSAKLAVDFRSGEARLRVFIENDQVSGTFVECPPGAYRTGDVMAAIRACP